jgi:RNA-binding protein
MLSGKQRSYLKGLAHDLNPMVYIGKAGLTQNVINELEISLETRELVKVKLQEGCELKAKDAGNQSAQALSAEFVQSIGRRFVLYRPSTEHQTIILPR